MTTESVHPAVLMTGVSGTLGSALAERLSSMGCKVIRIKRKASKNVINPAFTSFCHPVQIDLEHISDYDKEFRQKLGIDGNTELIVLNSGWGGIDRLTDGSLAAQIENASTLSTLIRKCAKIGVKKFVHLGTFEEDLLLKYISKESSSKLEMESGQVNYALAKVIARDIGVLESYLEKVDFLQVRFSIVVDHRDRYKSYVNDCVRNIRRNLPFQPPSNKGMVDIIHHDDLIEGIVRSLFNGRSRSNYYLGVAHPITLNDFFLDLQSGTGTVYTSRFEDEAIRLRQLRRNLHTELGMQYSYEYENIISRLLHHEE